MYHREARVGQTLRLYFGSYDSNGASVTMTGLAVTDIEIYKDGSMTQRSSDNGYALIDTDGIDLDGVTGIHGFSIDLSDNTDSGFFAVGSEYLVVLASITIDTRTVNIPLCTFRIIAAEGVAGQPKVDTSSFNGVAATASSGRPEVNMTHIAGSAVSTSTAQLGVNVVQAGATAWGSGAITAASIASDAITAAKIATDAITAAKIAADAISAAKIATGALTSAKFAAGAIDAAAIAADAIGASELAADAASEIATAVWAAVTRTLSANTNLNDLSAAGIRTAIGLASANLDTQLSTIAGYIDTEVATLVTNIATILAAVDTEVGAIKTKTDQLAFGTANRVNAQVYGMEADTVTASAMATDSIDAAALKADAVTEIQSGLATSAALATTDGKVDLIKTKTDGLPSDPADASDIAARFTTVDSALTTIAAYLDTEVSQIMAKTDNLPSDPADQSLIMAAIAALNNLSAAGVKAQVVEAIFTDTYAEPGAGAPAATLSLIAKVNYLFQAWRNLKTQTSSELVIYADDGVTPVRKAAVSDDGTTFQSGEMSAP